MIYPEPCKSYIIKQRNTQISFKSGIAMILFGKRNNSQNPWNSPDSVKIRQKLNRFYPHIDISSAFKEYMENKKRGILDISNPK